MSRTSFTRAALIASAVALLSSSCTEVPRVTETPPVDGGSCGSLGQACCDSASCGIGLSCEASVCQRAREGETGKPCARNSDCQSGICLPIGGDRNVCTVTCGNSTSCTAGWSCAELAPNGPVCQCSPSAETCDGLDNDCNGIIDDEPTVQQQCVSTLGAGATCSSGACTLGGTCQTDGDCLAGQTCNLTTHRCERAEHHDAGVDGGPDEDGGSDGGEIDSGFDAGPQDGGFDAGPQDGGFDAGPMDAGFDAGPQDAGFDAGPQDAGFDAGPQDGGVDGGPLPCGTAVIDVFQNGAEVDPSNTTFAPGSQVTLLGSAGGTSAAYTWRLAGTSGSISGSGAQVTLSLPSAGEYLVSLSAASAGCGTASTSVVLHVAAMSGGVRVQLTWPQTYGDLDLHYIGPGGYFGETTPYEGDLNWTHSRATANGTGAPMPTGNRSPDWGGMCASADPGCFVAPDMLTSNDAILNLDQRAGYGPEVATHPLPFDGTYQVSVHYYCVGTGTGTKTSSPIVQIFVNDSLVWSGQYQNLHEEQLWDAAQVVVSNGGTSISVVPDTARPHYVSEGCHSVPPVCEQDADCGSPTPYCNVATGACVACVTSDQCPAGDACHTNRCWCQSDTACMANAGAPHCSTGTGACVACNTNDQCGPGSVCSQNFCYCQTDDACVNDPNSSHCDSVYGVCVQCLDMSQCPAGNFCTANQCEPGACVSDEPCTNPSSPHCNVSTGYCVGCVTSDQCSNGYLCQDLRCVPPPCDSNDTCTSTTAPYCNHQSQQCVACTRTSECESGLTCQQYECVNAAGECATDNDCYFSYYPSIHCDTTVGACVQCVNDTQCANNQPCVGNICGCQADEDCAMSAAGARCEPTTGACGP